MLNFQFISKAFEHEECELWSLVRLYDIWCSISTEYVQEGICQAMGSGVFAHSNNFGPVGTQSTMMRNWYPAKKQKSTAFF